MLSQIGRRFQSPLVPLVNMITHSHRRQTKQPLR